MANLETTVAVNRQKFFTALENGSRYTVDEIAIVFGVHKQTARRWVKHPLITTVPGTWPYEFMYNPHGIPVGESMGTVDPINKDSIESITMPKPGPDQEYIIFGPKSKWLLMNLPEFNAFADKGFSLPQEVWEKHYEQAMSIDKEFDIIAKFQNANTAEDTRYLIEVLYQYLVLAKMDLEKKEEADADSSE
jgi:hypothetical protein